MLVAAAFLIAFSAEPDEGARTVHMEGTAPGVERTAFTVAVKNAQTAIVTDCIEKLVASRALAPFASIIENAADYIDSWEPIRQSRVGAATVVEIEAVLLEDRLRRDVASLLLTNLPHRPKVMILVAEQLEPQGGGAIATQDGPAWPALSKELEDLRLVVVDLGALVEQYGEDALLAVIGADPQEGARVARDHMADVLVLGRVTCGTQPRDPRSNLVPRTAELAMRVVRPADAAVLAQSETTGRVQSVRPEDGARQAVVDACEKACLLLVTDVVLGAVSRAPEPDGTVLTVGGPITPERAWMIEETITEGLPKAAVESFYVSPTMARIRVVTAGSPRTIAGLLELATFSGFRLEIRRLVGTEVAVELRELPGSTSTESAKVGEKAPPAPGPG
jgi:hypothetical protein